MYIQRLLTLSAHVSNSDLPITKCITPHTSPDYDFAHPTLLSEDISVVVNGQLFPG